MTIIVTDNRTNVISSPVVQNVVAENTLQNIITESSDNAVIYGDSGIRESFETVSKNLAASPYIITYVDGAVSAIEYSTPFGAVTKTFAYVSGQIQSITLSGAVPSGAQLTKTFGYDGDVISSIAYS